MSSIATHMSSIITHVDQRNNLTIHTLEGPINGEDIIRTMDDYYLGEFTRSVVWDYTKAELNECRDEDLKAIAKAANEYARIRKGCKTALVLPSDLQFGLGRAYETYAELEDETVQVQSFRSMAEARQWLGIFQF